MVKKRHDGLIAVGASLAAAVLLAGVVIGTGGISDRFHQGQKGHRVTYTVSGTSRGAGLITYTLGGSTEQEANRAFPWTKSYTLAGYAVYQVMAQNLNDPGTVTCSIEVDGKVVQTATATGPFTIAHCTSSSLR